MQEPAALLGLDRRLVQVNQKPAVRLGIDLGRRVGAALGDGPGYRAGPFLQLDRLVHLRDAVQRLGPVGPELQGLFVVRQRLAEVLPAHEQVGEVQVGVAHARLRRNASR